MSLIFQELYPLLDKSKLPGPIVLEVELSQAGACELLLKHCRLRQEPVYFVSREWKEKIAAAMEDKFKDQKRLVLENADLALEHRFRLAGNAEEEPYIMLGPDIAWGISPNGDREGLFTLNRMEWWTDLGKAYWLTGDERYAEEFAQQLEHWLDSCPAPKDGKNRLWDYSPWRSLEAGLRMRSWLSAYSMCIDSPHWTAERHARFMLSVHEHCERLALHVNRTNHNHTLMEMEGLLYGAAMFPEFLRSEEWISTAMRTLEACAREQVYEDGVHVEAVPGYHVSAIRMLAVPIYFAERNGIAVSQECKSAIKRMFEFAMYCHRPDGCCSPFGDTSSGYPDSRNDVLSLGFYLFGLQELATFARPTEELLWLTGDVSLPVPDSLESDGRVSSQYQPSRSSPSLSKAFPDGGFYCIQSGWEREAHYALFHCGPLVHGHPHADLLSFDLYAYGKALLGEAGKYTYNECLDRRYLKGTSSHSTVVVDGADQAEYAGRMNFKSVPGFHVHRWEEGPGYSLVDGEHDGYHRLGHPVTHRRQLLFVGKACWLVVDRLTGEGLHDIEQLWHFDSDCAKLVDPVTGEVCAGREGDPKLRILPLHTGGRMKTELYMSWVSDTYGSKRPAQVARYWMNRPMPYTLVTLLCPEPASETRRPSGASCKLDGETVEASWELVGSRFSLSLTNEQVSLSIEHIM